MDNRDTDDYLVKQTEHSLTESIRGGQYAHHIRDRSRNYILTVVCDIDTDSDVNLATTSTGRQRRKGYQEHPGQRDAPRVKRTSEQKNADDAKIAMEKQAAQTAKALQIKAKISKLAALEDQARQDEKTYELNSIRPDLTQAVLPKPKQMSSMTMTQQRLRVDDRDIDVGFNDSSSVIAGPDDDDEHLQ